MSMEPQMPMLLAVREHLGISRPELAAKSGVSERTIMNAERATNGRGVGLLSAKKISAALGISLDLLCGKSVQEMLAMRRNEVYDVLASYKAVPLRPKRGGKRTKKEASDGG